MFNDLTREVLSCGCNGYGVSGSILKTSQRVAIGGATINSHNGTASTIIIEDDVSISTTGPGHSDTSGTFLDCHNIIGS